MLGLQIMRHKGWLAKLWTLIPYPPLIILAVPFFCHGLLWEQTAQLCRLRFSWCFYDKDRTDKTISRNEKSWKENTADVIARLSGKFRLRKESLSAEVTFRQQSEYKEGAAI